MGDEKDAKRSGVVASGHLGSGPATVGGVVGSQNAAGGSLIAGPASVSGTARTRTNFAVLHLIAAARFSRHAGEIEDLHEGQRFGPFFEELLAYSSGCILLSVAALESYANELFVDAASSFPNEKPAVLEKIWAVIEEKPILDKFSFALTLRGAEDFDKGAPPYQDAASLIRLRNALTHFKPEWMDEQVEHKKLAARLQGRFNGSPFLPESEGLFPRGFASHGCTKWAVETCMAFAAEFGAKSGLVSKFSKHSAKLVP